MLHKFHTNSNGNTAKIKCSC